MPHEVMSAIDRARQEQAALEARELAAADSPEVDAIVQSVYRTAHLMSIRTTTIVEIVARRFGVKLADDL